MASDKGTNARGATTLLEALAAAERDGFVTQLTPLPSGRIRCGSCRNEVDADQFRSGQHQRLEGASDAADLLIVVRAACPNCGDKGVLTLGYGPNAGDADIAVLERLETDEARPER